MPDSDGTSPNAPTAPPPPLTATLALLLPFFVLVALTAVLVTRHFDWLWRAVVASGITGGIVFANRWVGSGLTKRLSAAVERLLHRRSTAISLAVVDVALVGVSFFVASVHIDAKNVTGMWLYRVEEPVGDPTAATIVDSIFVDRLSEHGNWVMRPARGKQVWFQTSTYRRTTPVVLTGWSAQHLAYPTRFDWLTAVTFLPVQRFLGVIAPGRPLRVVVTDAATGALVGDTTLDDSRHIPSLTLSVTPAPRPDSGMTARWRKLLVDAAATPEERQRAEAFSDWSTHHRWIKAKRPIARGDALRVTVLKANGDTITTKRVTLDEYLTHVLISRP